MSFAEPERDLVDEVMHFHRCCRCSRKCEVKSHPEWWQTMVSGCCGGAFYRVEYSPDDLHDQLEQAWEEEDLERVELLIHALGRLRQEYRAERERRRA